jgi:7-cyano-7-deazaguanine synthase in queuosine biosynthesis
MTDISREAIAPELHVVALSGGKDSTAMHLVGLKDYDRLARELAAYKQAEKEFAEESPAMCGRWITERVAELMRENDQ